MNSYAHTIIPLSLPSSPPHQQYADVSEHVCKR